MTGRSMLSITESCTHQHLEQITFVEVVEDTLQRNKLIKEFLKLGEGYYLKKGYS